MVDISFFGITNVLDYSDEKKIVIPEDGDGLYLIDISNWTVKRICELKKRQQFAPTDLILFQRKVWGISRDGLWIFRYDLDDGSIEYFTKCCSRKNLVSVLYSGQIFIIPKELPNSVVRFSLNDEKFYCDKNFELFESGFAGHIMSFTVKDYRIVATIKGKTQIIIFDLAKLSCELKNLRNNENYFGITAADEGFYLTSSTKKEVYMYDCKKNVLYKKIASDRQGFYTKVIVDGRRLILISNEGVDIFENGHINSICGYINNRNDVGSQYISYIFNKRELLLFPWNAYKIMVINLDSFICRFYQIRISFNEFFSGRRVLYEADMELKKYLTSLNN